MDEKNESSEARRQWNPLTVSNMLYQYGASLKEAEKAVVMAWIKHADRTGLAWPSTGEMARKTGCWVRAIKLALVDFEKEGVLTTVGKREVHTRRRQKDGTIKTVVEYRAPGGRSRSGTGFPAKRRMDAGALFEFMRQRDLKSAPGCTLEHP